MQDDEPYPIDHQPNRFPVPYNPHNPHNPHNPYNPHNQFGILQGQMPGDSPNIHYGHQGQIRITEIPLNTSIGNEDSLNFNPPFQRFFRQPEENHYRRGIPGLKDWHKINSIGDLSLIMKRTQDKVKFDPFSIEAVADYKNRQKEGPFTNPSTKDEYIGHCQSGMRHGIGVGRQEDGSYYNGFWYEDRFHGQGQLIYPNGECYVGEWHNGQKHGNGTFYYSNGTHINCSWKGDRRHGQGLIRSPKYKKDFQIGFKNDRLDGSCTVFEQMGYYIGMFRDGMKYGKGNQYYDDEPGIAYQQDYTNDVMQGYNEKRYSNGEVFKGLFENGLRSGKGELIQPNGWKYNGDWRDDMPHGQGTYEYGPAGRYTGQFELGQRKGKGRYIFSNRNHFDGIFDGVPKGPGEYKDFIRGGMTYQGEGIGHNKFRVQETGEIINMM